MRAAAVLLLLLLPGLSQAAAYRCRDAKGALSISDKPCPSVQQTEKVIQTPGAKPPEPKALDPDQVRELELRRREYLLEGLEPEEALRRAVADMQPPKPKTGADNNREYLEMRKRDAAEQDRAHDQWLQRSDAADDERQREQRDETLMRQYEDCEDQKRIETLRNGYSSKRCQKP